jgi:hypothetical protein
MTLAAGAALGLSLFDRLIAVILRRGNTVVITRAAIGRCGRTKGAKRSGGSNADLFGDDVIHHFGCAAANAVESDIAIGSLHLVLAEIAPTAVQLQAIVDDSESGLGGESLSHGDLLQTGNALRHTPGAGIDQLPRRLKLHVAFGETLPSDLHVGQMPGAIHALFHELSSLVETSLGGADAAGGNDKPFGLEALHDLVKAVVLSPQEGVVGQSTVVERQAARIDSQGLQSPFAISLDA